MTGRVEEHDVAFEYQGQEMRVSALLQAPKKPTALYVLAHGAGAGMRHVFMEDIAEALAGRGIATFRYQFPYMELGKKSPDPPKRAIATVRAAIGAAAAALPKVKLLAGGKSFGGRMTSTAAAEGGLEGVAGLVFLGFPLHAPNKPSNTRAAHLADVSVPMLFLQGTRDSLADLTLLRPIVDAHDHATMHVLEGGDHSFKVPKRSGLTPEDVMDVLADAVAEWAAGL